MFRIPCIHYHRMHNTIISIFRMNLNREIVTYQPTMTEPVLLFQINRGLNCLRKLVVYINQNVELSSQTTIISIDQK